MVAKKKGIKESNLKELTSRKTPVSLNDKLRCEFPFIFIEGFKIK